MEIRARLGRNLEGILVRSGGGVGVGAWLGISY